MMFLQSRLAAALSRAIVWVRVEGIVELVLMGLAEAVGEVVAEGSERVVLRGGDYGLSIAVGESLCKTLAREVEGLIDHLADGGALQIRRVRCYYP